MKIGLIGGSGLYEFEGLKISEEVSLTTPYGRPSSVYKKGMIDDIEVIFLSRHGERHTIPPHKINYRANIWGFKSLGVERIISVNAAGGINKKFGIGSIVLLDQIIDMTMGTRHSTFYDDGKVVHVDMTNPYCPEMREMLIEAADTIELPIKTSGTYICTNGPRLETAGEIKFFSMIGADVVGMTAMPEAALARELEICLAGVAIVTNQAAGTHEGRLTVAEVLETMEKSSTQIRKLLKKAILNIPTPRNCPCKDALKDAEL